MTHLTRKLPGLGLGLLAVGLVLGTVLLPEDSSPQSPKTIELRAVAGLQYDRVRFAVQPGQTVELTLRNASTLQHNLVFTTPGTREQVVAAANRMGSEAPEQEYVPRSDDVLRFIPVLDPDSSYTITFTAPSEEGVYPYVCTYPGHGVVMYGAMYVSGEGTAAMPPLEEDPHVPPKRLRASSSAAATSAAHPYSTAPPIVYRTFMPESSPASIAVGLKGGISYCFDTVPATVRYAWEGGFLDNSEVFRGHVADQRATLNGEVFFRNEVGGPLRLEDASRVPQVEFRGYRMLKGRPQFRYTMGDLKVRERVTPTPEGVGLRREFEIENPREPVLFVRSPQEGVTYEASAGTWRADTLRLRPEAARHFAITIRKQAGASAQQGTTQNQSKTQSP